MFYHDVFLYSFCDESKHQMSEAPHVMFWRMRCLAVCVDPSQILYFMCRKPLGLREVRCESVECIVMTKGKV
jgi:hypothetical protein